MTEWPWLRSSQYAIPSLFNNLIWDWFLVMSISRIITDLFPGSYYTSILFLQSKVAYFIKFSLLQITNHLSFFLFLFSLSFSFFFFSQRRFYSLFVTNSLKNSYVIKKQKKRYIVKKNYEFPDQSESEIRAIIEKK